MAIDERHRKSPPPPPAWGEITPEGERSTILRFVLEDRTVTFPISQLSRWEHTCDEPESLLLHCGPEIITVEGRELAPVRAALDLGRLVEIRVNRQQHASTQILSITLQAGDRSSQVIP